MKTSTKVLLGLGAIGLGLYWADRRQIKLPAGVRPAEGFKALKFLGNWYEIARLSSDMGDELCNVQFQFAADKGGAFRVNYKGYDDVEERWISSVGEARFVDRLDRGRLKMSFFKPFWTGFNIIDVDEEYKYALVIGNALDKMWILSRDKYLPEQVEQRFLSQATDLGVDTSELTWAFHEI